MMINIGPTCTLPMHMTCDPQIGFSSNSKGQACPQLIIST